MTGAASGIGAACAGALAARDASVVVADVDEGGGRVTVSAIDEAGGNASFVRTDVTRLAVDRFGPGRGGAVVDVADAVVDLVTDASLAGQIRIVGELPDFVTAVL